MNRGMVLFFLMIVLFQTCEKKAAKPAERVDSVTVTDRSPAIPGMKKKEAVTLDTTIVSEEDTAGLDTTIIRNVDLTGDSVADSVVLNLHITSWNEPVTWEFCILHDRDTLFREKGNDTRIDKIFGDPEFMNRCDSYLECKKRWYLERMLQQYVDTIEPSDERREGLRIHGKLYAEMEHSEYGTSREEALANWQWLWDYYADKTMIGFAFFRDPLGALSPLLVFHPKLGKFVPIYHP